MMPVVRKASGGLTDREKKIAHNAKVRQESDQGRANVHAVARLWHGINSDRRDNGTAGGSTSHLSLPGAYGATFSGTSTPRSTSPSQYHTAVNTPAVPMEVEPPPMHPRHAFRGKRISYATSTSNNQGNPSSNATNDQSRRSVDTLMSSPSLAPLTESHSSHWSPALSKSKVETQSTIPPQRRPTWPPPGYPKVEWEMVDKNGLLGRLSRFFGRYQLGAEPTTIPWATLPQLLAERRQYLRGVPFVCIPIVTNDQVDELSAPWNWNGELLGAMDWALVNNQLSFNARESGRRVLFEIIDENGAFSDSTLGYSDHWLNQFLPDTNPNSSPNSQSFNEPLTPVVSLKRSREDQDSPISPGDMSVDHDTKRRRPNGASSSVSPVDSRSERSVEPREKSFIERSWRDSSSASNETVAEEVIDPRELPLNRLVPSSLPPPLRKGRVFLRFGPVDATMGSSDGKEMEEETWEWIPPAGTPMGMKSSTVWNPTQARWRLVTGGRSLENLGSIETKEKTEFPDPMDGIILKYGSCEYVEERGQWEMIPHRNAEAFPWRIRWDEIFARWEWTPLPEPSQGA
ncbi:hypothetical protein FRC20_006861 [Serendipita sp. 405]|nr:hypothetical protein FRC20_006861 [Serendipita sp. 405]